jgi:glutaredoxin 2
MTIDLTSAGKRGLETLDSITDMQQSLSLINYYFKKLNSSLTDSSQQSEKVDAFLKANPTIEAEIINPPTSNSSLAERHEIKFQLPEFVDKKTMASPELSGIRLADANVFRSGMTQPLLVLCPGIPVKNEIINNFI